MLPRQLIPRLLSRILGRGTDAAGFCLCPAGPSCRQKPGKHPHGKLSPHGAKSATSDPQRIRDLLNGRTAYGLVLPTGVLAFDLDGEAVATWEGLTAINGPTPGSWGQTTKHGRHEAYRWPKDGPSDPGGNIAGIVTRRTGGYIVGPHSQIAGHVYEPDRGPDGLPFPFAPLPRSWAKAFVKEKARPAAKSPASPKIDCLACGALQKRYGENERYPAVLSLTMRLHTKGHTHEVQWEHVRDHLAPRLDPPKSGAEVRGDFDRATSDPARMDEKAAAWQAKRARETDDGAPPDHLVRQSRAAWYFAQIAGDRVRFDHGRGRWLIWSGHRWRLDEDGSVRRLWLDVLAGRYRRALKADDRDRARLTAEVQSAGTMNSAITAGLSIASNMEPLATTADAWDADPWTLGCENGVVDLRTGGLRPGRQEDMVSRSTGIEYDSTAACPRWIRFLAEVFAGDEELVDWYGLFIGTSLVGVVQELLGIHHERGNNGKSVAVRAERCAFGDYAVVIPVETLVNAQRTAGEATPDLMALRGAGIAFTSEPDQTAKLRGGALKRLASVDRMTGRPLYGMTQTWEPTHTVHLATNHLPAVEDATDGFWRRVALLPWDVRFSKAGEAGDGPREDPGILAWAVRGAVAFAAGRSLHPFPAAVRVRTDAYRAEEDKLSAFVMERVVYERDASVTVGVLFAGYEEWCTATDVPAFDRLGQKRFSSAFYERGHGVEKFRDATNRSVFRGASLRPTANTEHPEHPIPFGGTPHTNDLSVEVPQVPADAPDAPETTEVDLVAEAFDFFGDMLMQVSAEEPESRGWRCPVGPGHHPALRADGSTYCATCHPLTVARSDGNGAAPGWAG
jgi:putative DNA primase/helicase